MVINYIVIIITILCLLIMYKFATYLQTISNMSMIYSKLHFKRFFYSKQKNTIKAGDIIYTITAIFTDVTVIFPEIYKHVLLVIEMDGKLYTVESTPTTIIGKNKKSFVIGENVVHFPLEDRIKYELSIMYICQLNKELTKEMSNSLTTNSLAMKDVKYPSAVNLFSQFVLGMPSKTNTYVCYDFVYMLLTSIGILPNEYSNMSTKEIAKFITHIENIPLNDDYAYISTKQFIYDVDNDDDEY
jgi:hypothetical protein